MKMYKAHYKGTVLIGIIAATKSEAQAMHIFGIKNPVCANLIWIDEA